MKVSGILETILYAEDLDAIETFYSKVLGMEVFHRDPVRQVFFRCGDTVLLIFNPKETSKEPKPGGLPVPTHGASGPGHACFRASGDKIDQWRDHLIQHDVEIESDFHWPNGGRSIYFRDPAGNSLEFAEPGIWGLE